MSITINHRTCPSCGRAVPVAQGVVAAEIPEPQRPDVETILQACSLFRDESGKIGNVESLCQFVLHLERTAQSTAERVEGLERERDELKAEVADLKLMLGGDATFQEMLSAEMGTQLNMDHWAVKLLAASLAQSLADAKNGVTIELAHAETPMIVTVVRQHGKSPAEVINELQSRIAELKAQVAALTTATASPAAESGVDGDFSDVIEVLEECQSIFIAEGCGAQREEDAAIADGRVSRINAALTTLRTKGKGTGT